MSIMTPTRLTLVWLWVVVVGIGLAAGVAQNVEHEASDDKETTRGLLDSDSLHIQDIIDKLLRQSRQLNISSDLVHILETHSGRNSDGSVADVSAFLTSLLGTFLPVFEVASVKNDPHHGNTTVQAKTTTRKPFRIIEVEHPDQIVPLEIKTGYSQVNNQNPKIYISPLLLKQLHEQKLAQKEAELQRNLTNSADNKADFCKEATRVFGEALALKLSGHEVNEAILELFVRYKIEIPADFSKKTKLEEIFQVLDSTCSMGIKLGKGILRQQAVENKNKTLTSTSQPFIKTNFDEDLPDSSSRLVNMDNLKRLLMGHKKTEPEGKKLHSLGFGLPKSGSQKPVIDKRRQQVPFGPVSFESNDRDSDYEEIGVTGARGKPLSPRGESQRDKPQKQLPRQSYRPKPKQIPLRLRGQDVDSGIRRKHLNFIDNVWNGQSQSYFPQQAATRRTTEPLGLPSKVGLPHGALVRPRPQLGGTPSDPRWDVVAGNNPSTFPLLIPPQSIPPGPQILTSNDDHNRIRLYPTSQPPERVQNLEPQTLHQLSTTSQMEVTTPPTRQYTHFNRLDAVSYEVDDPELPTTPSPSPTKSRLPQGDDDNLQYTFNITYLKSDGLKRDQNTLKESSSEEQFDEDDDLDREEYSYESDDRDSDDGLYQDASSTKSESPGRVPPIPGLMSSDNHKTKGIDLNMILAQLKQNREKSFVTLQTVTATPFDYTTIPFVTTNSKSVTPRSTTTTTTPTTTTTIPELFGMGEDEEEYEDEVEEDEDEDIAAVVSTTTTTTTTTTTPPTTTTATTTRTTTKKSTTTSRTTKRPVMLTSRKSVLQQKPDKDISEVVKQVQKDLKNKHDQVHHQSVEVEDLGINIHDEEHVQNSWDKLTNVEMTDHNSLNANKILEAINAYKLPEDFLKDNANGDITTTPGIMVQPASPGGWLKNWNPGVSENGNPDGDLNDNRRHYYPYYNNNTAKNPHDQASLLTPDQGEPLNDLKDDDNNLKSLGMEDNSLEGSMTSATSKTPDDATLVSPEKLAYILIGVCCGLSILCLIIVAVSIGYNKSETQYRFSTGGGGVKVSKSIKLIKASQSDSSSSGGSGQTSEAEEIDTEGQPSIHDDLTAGMKLGPWFNGKNHTIQTLERQTTSRVFPTAVYLDKLDIINESGREGKEIKEEIVLERDLLRNEEEESLSSFDTFRKDPNLLIDPVPALGHRHRRQSPLSAPEDTTSTSKSSRTRMNFLKNNSYSLSKGSGVAKHNTKRHHHSKKQVLTKKSSLQQQLISDDESTKKASEEGSFHFLAPDQLEAVDRSPEVVKKESDILWSGNTDRLI